MEDATQTVVPPADLILDHLAEAVIYADLNGVIRRWNRAAEAMFGHSAAEAVGQSLDLIVPENLRETHWRGFDAAVQSGATRLHGHAALTRAAHKSGGKIYVEMSFALVVDASGTVLGSVAAARDVTERVEREKAARQAPKPGA